MENIDIVEEFFDLVNRGKEGKNTGVSTGLPKLDEYTEGLSQETSYLIGGSSGSGKTSYTLYSLLYNPLMSEYNKASNRDLHYLIFNYEMTTSQILAKLLAIYIFKTYGEVMTFRDMFSRGKDSEGNPNIITEEHYQLLLECKPILEYFKSKITFAPNARTYETFEETCFDYLKQFGTFADEFAMFDENTYSPNNSNQIIGIIMDHMNLMKASQGGKKKTIDDTSNCCVRMRNMCHIVSPILLMQLNRGGMDGNRIRADLMEPVAEDFKDSGTVFEDSQVVYTLYCPAKSQLAQHRKYDISKLGNRYISLKVLKNRFGESNIADALAYYGEVTLFTELPKHDEIFDYTMYKNPDWLLRTVDTNKPTHNPFKI